MTGIRRPHHDSAAIRQSVIEAVRRLENGNGAAPAEDAAGDFRRLTDALPHAAFVWLGIKIVYANRAACQLLGAESADDVIGRRATDLMQPEDRDALSRLLLKGARPAPVAETQRFTVRRGDGTTVTVRARLVTLDWQDHPAILAIISDSEAPEGIGDGAAGRNGLYGWAKSAGGGDPLSGTEPVDPPPEIEEAGWWAETRAPLSAYGDDLLAGRGGDENGAQDGRHPPISAFERVRHAVADTVLALPPAGSDGAILVETAAATLQWVAEPVPDGTADLLVPARPPELDEAQRLSEAALAAATNGIAIVDALAEGRPVIYVNAAFERITGFSFDEAVGRDLASLLLSGAGPTGIEPAVQAAAEGRPGQTRVCARRKDGTAVWSDLHLVPTRDGDGEVTHVVAIQDDVTGRVAEEERRRHAEARLGAFTGTAAEWFWETDADLRYTYVSDRYFELTGDRPCDVLGATVHEFQKDVPAETLDRFLAALHASRPFSDHVFSRPGVDGRTLRFCSRGVPVIDDQGAFAGYRGSARDITADLAAEHARGEAEAARTRAVAVEAARDFYRAILDNVPEPVCCIDQEGTLSHANGALAALFGRPVEELSVSELLPAPAALQIMNAAAGVFASETDADQDIVLDTGGSSRAFRISLQPLRTAGNAITLVQASWVETTSARAAESARQEIRSLASALRESEERLAASEAALRKAAEAADSARREAEDANAAKQRFIAGIGHQIRTPLNGMLGMAGLLMDSRLTEDQRHHAETVRQSGKAVLNVLNDMIELAKLKDGNAPLEISDFDFRSVAESVVEILAASAFAKGLDLGAYFAPNVPEWLAGDAGRLRQVLFNLIGNAIKRTERGAVTVKVNLAEQHGDRMILLVRVANTGAGLPAEEPARPFEASAGHKASGRGGPETTGFDLDICREIVRLMNGETGAEARPGCSPVVWIRIELARAKSAPRTRIAPYIAALNGRRALLVGGKVMTRQLLCKQLRAFGMTVGSVATGEDALAAVAEAAGRRTPYDLAFADLALPDMEATDFAQRVRDLPRIRDLRLILTAPTGRNVSRARAKELGFEAVLRKPIRQETLVRRCAALFGVDPEEGWSPARAAPRNATGRSLRILVAEDNPANQQIVAHMLINAGHRVDVANNGIEAVNAIRNVPYDLALMDIGMPEMDGVTAAKLVRSLADNGAALPLIAMTAASDNGPRDRVFDAGMNAVIEKPVDVAELERAIEDLCLPEEDGAPLALPREPRQVPPITPTEREELKNLLASLDGIVEARR